MKLELLPFNTISCCAVTMTDWNKAHLKVILIGSSGVGKSSFINQYVNHRFTNMYRATIGADFLTKEIFVNGRPVFLQIWDTAGTERFQSLGNALYRGAHCCLLLFDVTSAASFSALSGWQKEFLVQADPPDPTNFPFVVVGNKTDLNNREVSWRQASTWCREIGAEYFEGSAKDDVDVNKPFYAAAQAALQHYKKHALEKGKENVHLSTVQAQERAQGQCTC